MSIENLIAENTAAIKALTEAINRLTVPRGGVPAPAVASAPVPAVASAPVPAPALTLDVVRSACVRGGAAGITAEIVGFLGSCGVRNLNELDPAKYPDLMAFLASKGVN